MIPSKQSTSLTPIRTALFIGGLAAALILILVVPLIPARHRITVGAVAPYTIKSPIAAPSFVSTTLTNEEKKRAANVIADVIVYDPSIAQKQRIAANDLLQRIRGIKSDSSQSEQEKTESLKQIKEPQLSFQAIAATVEMSEPQWTQVAQETLWLIEKTMAEKLRPQDLIHARDSISSQIAENLSAVQALVVIELARAFIMPNLAIDIEETLKVRKQAEEHVPPVTLSISKGETILRDGEIITPLAIEKLQTVRLLNPSMQWPEVLGNAGLVALLCAALGMYLLKAQPNQLSTPKRLLLLVLMIAVTVLAAKTVLPGRSLWAYLFPFAAAPMLIATLLSPFLAVIIALPLSLLVAYAASFSPGSSAVLAAGPLDALEKVALYLVSGMVGVLMVWQAKRIHQYLISGAVVGAFSAAVVVVFWLLTPDRDAARLGWAVLAAMNSGFLSAVLTVGTFILLGNIFDITTSFHLMELAHPDHPLLRRLLLEAPGTYYHSLIVSNLAERAAEAIEADSLLARVGAYYHDAGKLLNPGFFIENQRAGENIHDRLDPTISASIVISHVKDGVQLANQCRLPNKVKDFMREHHGTRMAMFFYSKAAQEGQPMEKGVFSYPGPVPRSKETAIVMLADSIEATARARGSSDPEDLNALVEEIVAERIAEGQMDSSELTLQDMAKIKQAFKVALRGVFHPRIQYPQPPAEVEQIPSEDRAERQARQRPWPISLLDRQRHQDTENTGQQ